MPDGDFGRLGCSIRSSNAPAYRVLPPKEHPVTARCFISMGSGF